MAKRLTPVQRRMKAAWVTIHEKKLARSRNENVKKALREKIRSLKADLA